MASNFSGPSDRGDRVGNEGKDPTDRNSPSRKRKKKSGRLALEGFMEKFRGSFVGKGHAAFGRFRKEKPERGAMTGKKIHGKFRGRGSRTGDTLG